MKTVSLSPAHQALEAMNHALDQMRAQAPTLQTSYGVFQRRRTDGWPLATPTTFDTIEEALAFVLTEAPTATSDDGRYWSTETHEYLILTQYTHLSA